ncbi:hypothetical protein [Streptomyces albidoflavus]|uniref:hypothetical protein n=1 Tax=Streptomyces albidoflavus TaxID=1886 RepID=UPI0033B25332
MAERAVSFGATAAAYERFRPGYPAELLDLVTAYAGRPVRTALEIGAGTGKAGGRWPRVAALLETGGVFASFGGHLRPADPAVEDAVRTVRAPFL